LTLAQRRSDSPKMPGDGRLLGARATMDRPETEAWFAAQPTPFRLLVLLEVMHWLTIALRDVATRDDLDARARWEAAYLVSECNHRLVGYITAVMTGQPHYPDESSSASCSTISIIPTSRPIPMACGIAQSRTPPVSARIFVNSWHSDVGAALTLYPSAPPPHGDTLPWEHVHHPRR
jgi:hypothetical protein